MPIYDNSDNYNFPRRLNYGDKFLISIDKQTASEILKNSSKNKFKLISNDHLLKFPVFYVQKTILLH